MAGTQPLERLLRKITPLRILPFDKANLPRAIPSLDALFPLDRVVHGFMQLEIDERIDFISPEDKSLVTPTYSVPFGLLARM